MTQADSAGKWMDVPIIGNPVGGLGCRAMNFLTRSEVSR